MACEHMHHTNGIATLCKTKLRYQLEAHCHFMRLDAEGSCSPITTAQQHVAAAARTEQREEGLQGLRLQKGRQRPVHCRCHVSRPATSSEAAVLPSFRMRHPLSVTNHTCS